MFYLSRIEHTFRMPPCLLNLPIEEAIKGELEKLFLDKVCCACMIDFYYC
jgi:DNA-directed RNA polymerase III subunit RPC8